MHEHKSSCGINFMCRPPVYNTNTVEIRNEEDIGCVFLYSEIALCCIEIFHGPHSTNLS